MLPPFWAITVTSPGVVMLPPTVMLPPYRAKDWLVTTGPNKVRFAVLVFLPRVRVLGATVMPGKLVAALKLLATEVSETSPVARIAEPAPKLMESDNTETLAVLLVTPTATPLTEGVPAPPKLPMWVVPTKTTSLPVELPPSPEIEMLPALERT